MKRKQVVSYRLPDDVAGAVRHVARAANVSEARVVEAALRLYVGQVAENLEREARALRDDCERIREQEIRRPR